MKKQAKYFEEIPDRASRWLPHFDIRECHQENLVVVEAIFWRPTGNPAHPETQDLTEIRGPYGEPRTPWVVFVRPPNWFERTVQRRTLVGKLYRAQRLVRRVAEKRMARLRAQGLVEEEVPTLDIATLWMEPTGP